MHRRKPAAKLDAEGLFGGVPITISTDRSPGGNAYAYHGPPPGTDQHPLGGACVLSSEDANFEHALRLRRSGMTDFLIVGGGSAGCVLANRLSGAGAEVRLVEAGPDTPPGALPADINDIYPRSYYNHGYMWPGLQADQGGDGSGAKSDFLQARVMGGGSSVMGMIAVRGLPEDYDGWAADGAEGWGWGQVLAYFKRLEHDRDFQGPLHGAEGPVTIRRHHQDDWPPFCAAVGEAARRRGWPVVEDMNADFDDGYCRLPLSATLVGRVSAATAYLDAAARSRPKLAIEADTTVERLIFQGQRCVGATVIKDHRREERHARHVVVSAGAIHSPALLQRSGIGPASLLESLHIPVLLDLEAVGANLQNHPVVYLATHLARDARQSPLLRPQFNAGLRYTSKTEGARKGDMMMLVVNKSSWHGLGAAVAGIGVCLTAPNSRGTVRLTSSDPQAAPDVRFRMLSDPADFERMVDGMQLAVELMGDEAVRPLRHELFSAGYSRVVRRLNRPGVTNTLVTRAIAGLLDGPETLRRALIKYGIADRDIDETRMRRRGWAEQTVRCRAFGTYHPAGTCRMGQPDDRRAVVDARCAVHGVEGLSIVDASVMPTIVRANTNVPVIMMAERASDMLLGKAAGHHSSQPGLKR